MKPLVPAGLIAILCSGIASAGVIYSNFGAGQTFAGGVGLTPAFSAVASSFTPDATYSVDEYQIAAFRASPDTPDTVTFSLYSDANGVPGADIESFTLSGLGYPAGNDFSESTPPPGILSEDSPTNPVLEAGQQYWLVMSGINPGDVTWNDDGNGQTGAAAQNPDNSWTLLPNYSQGAFEIDGTLASDAAPEPASFLMLAGGLAAIVLLARQSLVLVTK